MNFHVLTLFPDMILDGLSTSILGRAREKGYIGLEAVNIRDFTEDKHKKVDDYPYGGGAGLLMQAQPVFDAHRFVTDRIEKSKVRTIYLTPQGCPFNQRMAEELAREEELIFLCGHYEGIDERVLEEVVTDYVSLGDFVLTGGELAAMVMIDAIARLVPGVLHNDTSAADESFSGYLLEYPQYSRPEIWQGKKVPEALLSGDHKKIREWRQYMAEERTRIRRPDLYAEYEKLMRCRDRLMKNKLHHMDMIELINRGQAKLLYGGEDGVLLQDRISGAYMLTVKDRESGERILDAAFADASEAYSGTLLPQEEVSLFVAHQEFMADIIAKWLHLKRLPACFQMVYTRKEALPQKKADIRRLETDSLPAVLEHYEMIDESSLRERIQNGFLYGIYVEDKLAGFIGEHEEGSMGMLTVLPPYRRQGLASILETDQINRTLKKGRTPFCQVWEDNAPSLHLQEKLGLYPAKEKIWWLVKEEA